ncbi:MAG: RDD family protein [Acidobacteriota bacterium]
MNDRRDEPWLFDLDFGDSSKEEQEEDEAGVDEPSVASEESQAAAADEAPAPADFAFGEESAAPRDSFPFDDPPSELPKPLSPDELPLFSDQPSEAVTAVPAAAESPAAPVLPLADDGEPAAGPVPVEASAETSAGGGIAAFRERAVAVAVDGLLLVTVLGLCLLGSMAVGGPGSPLAHALPFGTFLVVFSFVYSVVSLAFWGQTPGMAIAGVVARAPGDQPLTFGQTGMRWLGGLLTVALAGLPFLLSLTGRSLADRLSGSETFQVS